MSEYIERETLLKHAIALNNPHELGENVVPVSDIEAAPAADVAQVVRCKDCKHNGTWQCHMEYDEYHPEADIHHEMHGDDDFCSYGKKEAT